MKIALVCDWYRPRIGGIEQHLEGLAQRLSGAGHDVVVVTPTRGAARVDGVRVRRIATPLAPVYGFLMTPAGIRAIGEALAEERVDVAHSHVSIVSPAAIGGAAEAERRGIPSVVTFHSIVPKTPWLAHAMRTTLNTDRWRARFTAVSERVAREVRPAAGALGVEILPNGIDAEFWRGEPSDRFADRPTPPAARPSPRSRLELVSVMRLNAKKRPLALVDIMLELERHLGAAAARLRVVGDGPQRDALQRAVDRARLGDRIELLGRCSRETIRDLLVGADAFVLPTIRESFGLAALEARCAGVPIVAMAQSGVAEVITHEREGLLGRTDAELAAHLARLAHDDELRSRIAQHNRTTTTAFDWPIVVEAHECVYRDAIALRASVRAER